jgi:hypothetical protein
MIIKIVESDGYKRDRKRSNESKVVSKWLRDRRKNKYSVDK